MCASDIKKISIDEAFASVVRRELARQGVGAPWLARASGIPARTIRSILHGGQATVKLHHVCSIAQALGVRCAEIVARADAMVDHRLP